MSVNALAAKENAALKKYRHAAYGFLILNLIYILLLYVFPPPFDPGLLWRILITVLLAALILVIAFFLHKGNKKLAIVMAVVYAARFVVIVIITFITGQFVDPASYVLTCLILTFYMLGRAAWDWP